MLRLKESIGFFLAGVFLSEGSWMSAHATVDFYHEVFPILEARCFKCHSDEKQKGDLRLDSPAWILRGSENGKILTPGQADDSPLYYLTTYDPDDPDYMPSKGKGLTVGEQGLLRRWIEEGARFGDEASSMMEMSEAVPPSSSVGKKYTEDQPLPPATYDIPTQFAETVESLRELGLLVDTVNHDANRLELSFTYAGDERAFEWNRIEPLAASVVKLGFARSKVSDRQLAKLPVFENLRSLDLRDTAITDAALESVGELEGLESLNLYGTAVTDAGIAHLYRLKQLRQLYLRGTSVSAAGANRLQQAIPGLRVLR
ncbi:hypothetical protein IEN85_08350 [Pelagicoccus sp. NFK12]|uniref:Cytochrome C Planctomycete-type domain-containing protein n=1 Tax=Pelagicoccus enzymogenes TaxID=2773457 RepID=A0A927IEW9_9BACT|nr:c-type cytochrome domain-containing protein [Pelagicoccus enzymogenes]MBD5779502.1 hypothetical protein [Pelagicoccus enzymogenes]